MFSRSRLLGLLLVGLAASLLLVVGVALAVLPPGGTFVDDNGNAHEGNIEAIAAKDITKGCNAPVNDRYCPTSAVTRGQTAAFLNRAFNLPAATVDYFTDDNNSIFEDDINAIAKAGVTNGCNPPANDHFCPDGIVTREQMAAFLNRTIKYPAATIDYFNDDNNSIFEPHINAIAKAGITLGCNPPANNKYCPSGIVARDQMASFLARAMGLAPIVPPPPASTTTTTTPAAATTAWFCDFAYPDGFFCEGDTDPISPELESWACVEGSEWGCAGEIDAVDLGVDSWSCIATSNYEWACSGEIDNRTSTRESWTCAAENFYWGCQGNIDTSDAANEIWVCALVAPDYDWRCAGDFDKGFAGQEELTCSIGGPPGRAYECVGSQSWLDPVVSSPDILLSTTLDPNAGLAAQLAQLESAAVGTVPK